MPGNQVPKFLTLLISEEEGDGDQHQQLVFSHKLVSGKAPPSHLNYGLQLAASTLQEDLMKRARSFAEKVERGRNSSFKENVIDQASLRAVVKLKRLRRSGLGGAELAEAVAEVRRQLLMETSSSGGDSDLRPEEAGCGDEEVYGDKSEHMEEESREMGRQDSRLGESITRRNSGGELETCPLNRGAEVGQVSNHVL